MSDESVSQLKPAPKPAYEPITDALGFIKDLSYAGVKLKQAVETLHAKELNFDEARQQLDKAHADMEDRQREYLALSERLHASAAQESDGLAAL